MYTEQSFKLCKFKHIDTHTGTHLLFYTIHIDSVHKRKGRMTVQMKEWEMCLVKIHRAETFFPFEFSREWKMISVLCVCVSERVKCAVSMRHRKLLYFTFRRVCRSRYTINIYIEIFVWCVRSKCGALAQQPNSRFLPCSTAGPTRFLRPGVFVPFGQPWKLLINLIYPGKNDDVYNLYIVLALLAYF